MNRSILDDFKTDKARSDAEAAANPPPLVLKPTLLQIDQHHPNKARYRITRNGKVERDYLEVDVYGRCGVRVAKDGYGRILLFDDNPIHEKVYGDFTITLIYPDAPTDPADNYVHDDYGFYFGVPYPFPQTP